MIREAIEEEMGIPSVIKDGDTFSATTENYPKIIKMVSKKYGINPAYLKWTGMNVQYTAPKTKTRKKISKPKNMTVSDYYYKLVLPNNPKLQAAEDELPDEDWKPVQNVGRYFGGKADYSGVYEVSNYGRLRKIDLEDAVKSRIYVGYDAPQRNAMQFHLNVTGEDGKTYKTCPPVENMVADAWLEPRDPKQYKVVHKDGDYHNNTADNLEWVPRKA